MAKIDYKIEIDSDLQLITVYVRGIFNGDNFTSISEEVRRIANDKSYNVYYNLVGTEMNMSVTDIYFKSHGGEEKNKAISRATKIAALVNTKDFKKWKFSETVNFNRGYLTMAFLDENSALEWLAA